MQYMRIGSGKSYIEADEACSWDLVMRIICTYADCGAEEVSFLIVQSVHMDIMNIGQWV